MIIDYRAARYLAEITWRLEGDSATETMVTTNVCAECGQVPNPVTDQAHVIWTDREFEGLGRIVVIIGCEGYWMIDPQSVGLVRGGWMSPDAQINHEVDHAGPIAQFPVTDDVINAMNRAEGV